MDSVDVTVAIFSVPVHKEMRFGATRGEQTVLVTQLTTSHGQSITKPGGQQGRGE